eukprot:jgi/Psemu1/16036/gm1.16036_g
MDNKHSNNNHYYKGGQGNNSPNDGSGDRPPRHCNQGAKGTNNSASTSAGGGSNPRFQGQDQTDMKGIVIDHSIDHRTPVLQQFDTFYKAVKVAASKLNPDLAKPIWTLIGLTTADYSVDFPEASLWTKGGVEDTHKKEMYSRLWLEEKKERSKDRKKYESDLKKLFAIMFGQLSTGITERLKVKPDWKHIVDDANALKLIKHLKEVCYRDNESSISPPVDVITKIKKFVDAY